MQPQSQPSPQDVESNTTTTTAPPAVVIAPTQPAVQQAKDPAVELIRGKIDAIYAEEPGAAQEIAEVQALDHQGSNHQQYMAELSKSGKSMAEIQAAWHAYYVALPDQEKYKVWQEFYVANGSNPAYQQYSAPTQQSVQTAPVANTNVSARVTARKTALNRHTAAAGRQIAATTDRFKKALSGDSAADIKKRILHTAKTATSTSGGGKLTAKHHVHSLLFGLGAGMIVVFIFLFGFFNEFLIAPFVQPSRQVNNTPVIVDAASAVVSEGTKVIIPKINVEIPTDYSVKTTDVQQIELALDKGVVHYPTTVLPGQAGNGAYFGHSSNNIFNPGKYKFAFVLLHKLEIGDTFYLTYQNKNYAYHVFSKRVVSPTEVGVLGPVAGKTATATLITCDPPGTSINRLVVVGEQISPDPAGNVAPETPAPQPVVASVDKTNLPGNGPTLWSRIWGSVF